MFTFAVVSLRLMGFYFILSWMMSLTAVYSVVMQPNPYDGSTLPNGWLVLAFPLIGGLLVIAFSEMIAALIVPRRKDESGKPGEASFLRVGMALIGLWVAAPSISRLASAVAVGFQDPVSILPSGLGAAIGILLVVLARYAPQLFGLPPQQKSEPDVFS